MFGPSHGKVTIMVSKYLFNNDNGSGDATRAGGVLPRVAGPHA
jgi:hypothetical protein